MQRRKFLSSSIVLGSMLGIGCSATKNNKEETGSTILKLKGKTSSGVTHWDVITIGNLSRNRYWGESEEKSLHAVICTTTLISGKDFHVIVDPSLESEEAMAAELKRRSGLTPADINVVFMTHEHGDHHAGLKNFPKAQWLASDLVADALNRTGSYSKKIEAAGKTIFDLIDVVSTPGHTPGTAGLRFDYRGISVFVAGDAVATKDFWDEGRMYFKALDVEESLRSYKKIASLSDIVVPGHDNYFVCR